MLSLDGPWLRWREARDQTKALQVAIDDACNRNPHSVTVHPNLEERCYIVRAKMGALDPVWGVRAGEIMHNLRACLDEITWQLACDYEPRLLTPDIKTDNELRRKSRKVQFPICNSPCAKPGHTEFHGAGTSHLSLVDPVHWTRFEGEQPYAGRNLGDRDPLWLLKELNDSDKHRVIHVAVITFYGGSMSLIVNGSIAPGTDLAVAPGTEFIDGAEITRVPSHWFATNAEVQMNLKLRFNISFGKTCEYASGLSMIHTLAAMRDRVEGIIKAFAPLFP